jgi:hypothetical protein
MGYDEGTLVRCPSRIQSTRLCLTSQQNKPTAGTTRGEAALGRSPGANSGHMQLITYEAFDAVAESIMDREPGARKRKVFPH